MYSKVAVVHSEVNTQVTVQVNALKSTSVQVEATTEMASIPVYIHLMKI